MAFQLFLDGLMTRLHLSVEKTEIFARLLRAQLEIAYWTPWGEQNCGGEVFAFRSFGYGNSVLASGILFLACLFVPG